MRCRERNPCMMWMYSSSECLFTQCVDDSHGQLNTEEHEGPACSPQSPRLHTVILVFFGKNLLQETIQVHQLAEPSGGIN